MNRSSGYYRVRHQCNYIAKNNKRCHGLRVSVYQIGKGCRVKIRLGLVSASRLPKVFEI